MNSEQIVEAFAVSMTAEIVKHAGDGFVQMTFRARVSEAGGLRFVDVMESFLSGYDARITDVRHGGCVVVAVVPCNAQALARVLRASAGRVLGLDAIESVLESRGPEVA